MTTDKAMKQIRQEREERRQRLGLQTCGKSAHPLTKNGNCHICNRQDELVAAWWALWEETARQRASQQ